MRSQKIIHKSVYTKSMSLLLIIAFLFAMIPAFGISASILGVNAESKLEKQYGDLFEERKLYLEEFHLGCGEMQFLEPYISEVNLTVLLYTDIAQTLTFEKVTCLNAGSGSLALASQEGWFSDFDTFYVESPEINEAIKDALYKPYNSEVEWEGSSLLRACIKYFNISKEELKKANKKMVDDPDSIRNLLSFLSDSEYENAKVYSGKFYYRPIPDYAIEALYLKDDIVANNLLCCQHSIYLGGEFNRIITHREFRGDINLYGDLEGLHKKMYGCDLTPFWVGEFFELYKDENIDGIDGLISERQKQLANPKTGEAWYFIPVAAVSLVAGIFVICPRRKRMLEG